MRRLLIKQTEQRICQQAVHCLQRLHCQRPHVGGIAVHQKWRCVRVGVRVTGRANFLMIPSIFDCRCMVQFMPCNRARVTEAGWPSCRRRHRRFGRFGGAMQRRQSALPCRPCLPKPNWPLPYPHHDAWPSVGGTPAQVHSDGSGCARASAESRAVGSAGSRCEHGSTACDAPPRRGELSTVPIWPIIMLIWSSIM